MIWAFLGSPSSSTSVGVWLGFCPSRGCLLPRGTPVRRGEAPETVSGPQCPRLQQGGLAGLLSPLQACCVCLGVHFTLMFQAHLAQKHA